MARALYICYFGLRQPLVQTQVLPYLRELRKDDHKITLLTFEPDFSGQWTKAQISSERNRLRADGIEWLCLPYHKRPSAIATAYDIFRGAWLIRRLIAAKNIDILHGRVHVPALMAELGRKFSRRRPKLLFDVRGFFPEEYTDAGIWPENGWLYRAAKRVERSLMKESDGFVVLTEKARDILFPEIRRSESGCADTQGRPVEVIPCCVDLKRFASANDNTRQEKRRALGLEHRWVIVYVGSFGGWYLTEETADLFGAAKTLDPSAFAMILTQSKPEIFESLLRKHGFSAADYLIRQVEASEIPTYLSAADAAVSFIKPCYSKQASSPTKNAEYLACGLPVITNRGIGDVDGLIGENGVGVLLKDFSKEGYVGALNTVKSLGDISAKCRAVAAKFFDLDAVGGERYRRLYEKLMSDGEQR